MKVTTIFLALALTIAAVSAKPHSAVKTKAHDQTKLTRPGEHHFRDERATETSTTQVKPTPKGKDDNQHAGSPPELQLHQVTEHNIRKNQDDKDEISMESEHLIHVTQKPAKAQKPRKNGGAQKSHSHHGSGLAKAHHKPVNNGANGKKKPHHKTNSSSNAKAHHKHPVTGAKAANIKVKSTDSHTPAGQKPKAHNKPVKKYNSKKHGWKKNTRKEKAMEKQKEKREKREKKLKAIHHN